MEAVSASVLTSLCLIFVSTMAVGCILDFSGVGPGSDGSASGAGGTGGVGGNGGAPATCEVGVCVAVPEGFDGIAVFVTEGDCGDREVLFQGGSADAKIDAPPATCTCACAPPVDLGCPPVHVDLHDGIDCGGPLTPNVQLTEETCQNLVVIPRSLNLPSVPIALAEGSCVSTGTDPMIQPATFDQPVLACDETPPACSTAGADAGVCLEKGGSFCFFGPDDAICPEGFSTTSMTRFQDLEDSRDCQCECNHVLGSCDPAFQLFADPGCPGRSGSLGSGAACITSPFKIASVRYDPQPSEGCDGGPGPPTGAVARISSTKLCCFSGL